MLTNELSKICNFLYLGYNRSNTSILGRGWVMGRTRKEQMKLNFDAFVTCDFFSFI